MRDLRATESMNQQAVLGRSVRLGGMGGYVVDEESVMEMLVRMGVDATPEMVQEAIGYLSAHSMEFNMSNLYDFFKSKQIMSTIDLRDHKRVQGVQDLRG